MEKICLAKSCITSIYSAERWRGTSLGREALGGHHSLVTITAGTEMVCGFSLSSQNTSRHILLARTGKLRHRSRRHLANETQSAEERLRGCQEQSRAPHGCPVPWVGQVGPPRAGAECGERQQQRMALGENISVEHPEWAGTAAATGLERVKLKGKL